MAVDVKSPVDFSPSKPYNTPTFPHDKRARRSSSRASATSQRIESPRTLCPPDGDAFSYKAGHLPAWYISHELWECLPPQLQALVAAMQHAGAAVLTGFERVEEHSQDLKQRDASANDKDAAAASEEDNATALEDHIPDMPSLPLKLRTFSTSSSQFDASMTSSVFLPSPSSASVSPPMAANSDLAAPISPVCLGPADAQFPLGSQPSIKRERSFSTPLEPHDAYYATELSQLRTESLPRLRHRIRAVETHWREAKNAQNLNLNSEQLNGFENWLAENKVKVHDLNGLGTRMSDAIGLSSTGMGWKAP